MEEIKEKATMYQKQFEFNATKIKREGIDKLLAWLETTDFYTAPATTKFHDTHVGGLVSHCIQTCMLADVIHEVLIQNKIIERGDVSEESIILVALFHSLYKVNTYVVEAKNIKNEKGVWEKVPFYKYEPDFILGKSSKSLYYIQKFISISDQEAQAIFFNDSFYDEKKELKDVMTVLRTNPLAYIIFNANIMAATIVQSIKE